MDACDLEIEARAAAESSVRVPASLCFRERDASWSLSLTVQFPAGIDSELLDRLDRAGRRLSRGAVCAKWKAKKLAAGLEAIATLFDGVR